MQFFTWAKQVKGENSSQKSANRIVMASSKRQPGSGEGVFDKLWAALSEFEGTRQYDTCVIVSVSEQNVAHCVKAADRDTLVVTAADLNRRNFSHELGKLLLGSSPNICLETEGLDVEGTNRLASILEKADSLFDNRLRLVLFTPGNHEDMDLKVREFSEKHFKYEDLVEQHKKTKIDKKLETVVETDLETALKKNRIIENENLEMKQKYSELSSKLEFSEAGLLNITSQSEMLKSDIKEVLEKNKTLKKEIFEFKEKVSDFAAKETEINDLQKKLGDAEIEILKLKQTKEEARNSLTEELSKVTETVKWLETSNGSLCGELAELKIEYKTASERDLNLISELEKKVSEAEPAQSVIGAQKEARDSLEEELSKVKENVKRLETSNESLALEMAELKIEYRIASERDLGMISELENKVSEVESARSVIEADLKLKTDALLNMQKLVTIKETVKKNNNKTPSIDQSAWSLDKAKVVDVEEEETIKSGKTAEVGEDKKLAIGKTARVEEKEKDAIDRQDLTTKPSSHPLCSLIDRIESNRSKAGSAKDLAYLSIKNLKCLTSYSKTDTTICKVVIVKAKHNLLKYPSLLTFCGKGENESSAQLHAFESFMISLDKFCSKSR